MEPAKLSFIALLEYLNRAILGIKDPRRSSNATKYSVGDAVLGAFSVFFMQSESFLEHQRHMDSNQGRSNAQTLFGMIKVPTVPQIRNIVDGISATSRSSVFNCVYQGLLRLVALAGKQKMKITMFLKQRAIIWSTTLVMDKSI